MKHLKLTASVLIAVLLMGIVVAQPSWKLLGLKKVKLRTERDVILVGAKEGTFKRIKLTVRQSGLNMKDMKVHFMNGDVFDVTIRKLIPAGGETRIIDLPGVNRQIEKVVFWYESTNRNDRRATVRLWGRQT